MIVATLVGCGSGEYDLAPVSGQVMLNGSPLVGAIINTQPIASGKTSSPGPGSFGKTDKNGQYSLEVTTTGVAGAVVGAHRVTIRMPDSGGIDDDVSSRRNAALRLPPTALDGSLRLEVGDSGNDNADFALQSTGHK